MQYCFVAYHTLSCIWTSGLVCVCVCMGSTFMYMCLIKAVSNSCGKIETFHNVYQMSIPLPEDHAKVKNGRDLVYIIFISTSVIVMYVEPNLV